MCSVLCQLAGLHCCILWQLIRLKQQELSLLRMRSQSAVESLVQPVSSLVYDRSLVLSRLGLMAAISTLWYRPSGTDKYLKFAPALLRLRAPDSIPTMVLVCATLRLCLEGSYVRYQHSMLEARPVIGPAGRIALKKATECPNTLMLAIISCSCSQLHPARPLHAMPAHHIKSGRQPNRLTTASVVLRPHRLQATPESRLGSMCPCKEV